MNILYIMYIYVGSFLFGFITPVQHLKFERYQNNNQMISTVILSFYYVLV